MNGLERVLGTLGGKPLDRRAFAPVLSLYGAGLTGASLERHYTDAETYASGAAAVRDAFQPDVLYGPFAFALVGEAFGATLQWFPDQPPNVKRPAADSSARWKDLSPPDPRTHPRLVYFREAVALMAARHGKDTVIAAPLPSPADLPGLVVGISTWMETLLFEPELARRIMEDASDLFVELANGLFAAGAAMAVVPSSLTLPHIMPPQMAAERIVPTLAAAFGRLTGPVVLHHVGAPMLASLPLFKDLPNVVGFAIDVSDDPVRARAMVGLGKVLLLGPAGPSLGSLDPARAAERCLAQLTDVASDPHVVLCTTGADVPLATRRQTVAALKTAAEQAGWRAA